MLKLCLPRPCQEAGDIAGHEFLRSLLRRPAVRGSARHDLCGDDITGGQLRAHDHRVLRSVLGGERAACRDSKQRTKVSKLLFLHHDRHQGALLGRLQETGRQDEAGAGHSPGDVSQQHALPERTEGRHRAVRAKESVAVARILVQLLRCHGECDFGRMPDPRRSLPL